jgi:hypothetical protein
MKKIVPADAQAVTARSLAHCRANAAKQHDKRVETEARRSSA